ncbi:MAG: methylmalonyl-CoA mutase family protein [Caldilineaceae bacterium]|nr:methylmalonyl-CoA mutase family protein [Caldilineaceae bacterium]MBP8106271.1 methylmalonyl-CoA mutase family protein [Caldilineaceae bacterium]MBP8121202.1 methylmalonyl-CoA mutase family protein [Caldilineaceae bacterium]MBP9071595.1 methylmalonyl-CoA mutase family protein [Caldilineaceae bacterium]
MSEQANPTKLAALKAAWQTNTLDKLNKRFPERKPRFTTSSDATTVAALYTPEDTGTDPSLAESAAYLDKLGFPGDYPFTRGVQPNMFRGRFWTMRQYAGFGTAAESNERYHYLIQRGQTGLSVAFDLPTQIGYDADDEMALGEVGKVGVSISSLRDMETLLGGIPLDKVSISMTINAPAAVLLAMVIAVAKQQGVPVSELRGTIQNDILKEYIARGTYIFPPVPSMRLITDIFRFSAAETPKWNTISISGYHIREAGSTAAQEVAFTLANAIEYVKQATDAGLDVDLFADQLSFFFNAHNNFLEEVAKFRAARRLWATIMRERFGAKKPGSWRMRFHTQTGGSTLTAQQPDNNIVRVTLQALAAVLGGTQSLHTNSRDEALALPTEHAVEIALRTQQIIAHESGAADTVDPLGGSYYIEWLTDRIEADAVDYIRRIDDLGGALRAVEAGFVQREIQDAAYKAQLAVESNDAVVVGVNKFQTEESPIEGLLRVDESVQISQVAALKALRDSRDNAAVTAILGKIETAAQDPDASLMPLFVEAVEAYATLGEICNVLRRVFGEYEPGNWV